jgi:hypothetical protein
MTLLYRTAEWHAFAKLRLHTESTLQHLEQLTTELGQLTRKFRDTTQSAFATFELPKETEARKRRQNSGKGKEKATAGNASGKNLKHLNLSTYKWHALGDYVRAIRLFGPTDGFSTQVVSNLFSMRLNYLCFLVNRVNLLTKLSSACTDRQTSAMPSPKLLSAIEGLNAPVWPLIGSGFIVIPSREQQIKTTTKQQIKKTTSRMVTRS